VRIDRRRVVRGSLLIGLGLVTMACARARIDSVEAQPGRHVKPDLIVVHDFAVSPHEVALDSAVGAQIEQILKGTPEVEQRLQRGREIAALLTRDLVQEIGKLGIPTVPASATTPARTTLSIEGQILTVDEGNRLRRTMIGLGSGASEVRNMVQVYETTSAGRNLIEDFYVTALSSRKPGLGPMAGAGAVVARTAETAVGGTVAGFAAERAQAVEADVNAAAREIAKELRKFFVAQGWIQ
jgi:Domain of unknown function (DUF4410)